MWWIIYGVAGLFLYKKLSKPSTTPAPTEPVASVDVTGGSAYTGFLMQDNLSGDSAPSEEQEEE